MTKAMLMMWGVFAEMEPDIISQRVKFGMENARAKEKKIGRPSVTADNLSLKFLQYCPMHKRNELTISDFAGILHCSRTTIYKYLKIKDGDSK